MEIKGKFATAVCYAKEIEPGAEEQIRAMCDQQFTEGCLFHMGKAYLIREAVFSGEDQGSVRFYPDDIIAPVADIRDSVPA